MGVTPTTTPTHTPTPTPTVGVTPTATPTHTPTPTPTVGVTPTPTTSPGTSCRVHYAVTNQLTFPVFDPFSRQPGYKACAVRIEKKESRSRFRA